MAGLRQSSRAPRRWRRSVSACPATVQAAGGLRLRAGEARPRRLPDVAALLSGELPRRLAGRMAAAQRTAPQQLRRAASRREPLSFSPMTDADLVNALRDCYDTLQQRNIVDLGLVQSAALMQDTEAPGALVRGVPLRYIAHITLRAPGSDDTRNAQLRAQIENRLAGLPEISRTEIEMLPALFPILGGRPIPYNLA